MMKQRGNTAFYGSSLIIASSLFYGSYGVWTRLMGNSFGPYMQAWIRAVIIIAIMLPIALFGRQKWQKLRWREDKWWFLLWSAANWMIGAPLYYATNHIGIGLTTLIMYSSYLVSMMVLGRLLSGERFSGEKQMATGLALVGLFLICAPSFHSGNILAYVAAAAGGFSVGLDMVVSQKISYSSSQTTVLAWATGLVGSVPAAFLLHEHVPPLLNVHWLYLLAFVVVCIAASWLSIHGVKLIEAGTAGILGLLEIVWAVLFGLLFFHERPRLLAYFGAVFVISAAIIPYLKTIGKHKMEIIEEVPV